jgi:phytoene dehydrogenase-like protein
MSASTGQAVHSVTQHREGRFADGPSVAELASVRWDAIVVGAGHNGLACSWYLARSGKKVLVLESRERVGGACTIAEPFPGYKLGPCAYLAGLLHPTVIAEMGLPALGYHWTPATSGMFVPFLDGGSIQFWDDDERCDDEVRRFAPADLAGFQALGKLKARVRDKLRPEGPGDLWLEPNPTREMIEDRLGNDELARKLLFEWSMADLLDHFLTDERLRYAQLGQGVIGTNASPLDPGTASVHFHHASGRLGGMPGQWGYVRGGMGMVSFLMADAALSAGVTIRTGVPVAEIVPGESVRLECGTRIAADSIVSNADPTTALKLLGTNADATWAERVRAVPAKGCTVKLNVALRELPNFVSRPGTFEVHHKGQINTPLTHDQWQESFQAARNGQLPGPIWTELYFQTAHDPSVAPAGRHTMSVFAQYVPQAFANGKSWDEMRSAVQNRVLGTIAAYCSNLPEAIEHVQVLGPPDIEREVGLTGGHIFQGECLPQYMWDKRLTARTPMDGFYLCGAATHPGGSVIGVNGRNAAREVIRLSSKS